MADKTSSENLRRLLKAVGAGGGAVIAGKQLPESWTRPVLDSVMLPAHAQAFAKLIVVENAEENDVNGTYVEILDFTEGPSGYSAYMAEHDNQ